MTPLHQMQQYYRLGVLDNCSRKSTAISLAPLHQMQQYYRLGVLDNCSRKWNALVDCLTLKTKRTSVVEEILETLEKAKPHIWSFRTPEEAASRWKELFGNLDEVE
ncbi:hypothetical protein ACSBR2_033158 [Camellia fascicularis]